MKSKWDETLRDLLLNIFDVHDQGREEATCNEMCIGTKKAIISNLVDEWKQSPGQRCALLWIRSTYEANFHIKYDCSCWSKRGKEIIKRTKSPLLIKLPCFDHMHGYLLFNGKRKEIFIILDAIIYCLKYAILQLWSKLIKVSQELFGQTQISRRFITEATQFLPLQGAFADRGFIALNWRPLTSFLQLLFFLASWIDVPPFCSGKNLPLLLNDLLEPRSGKSVKRRFFENMAIFDVSIA